MEENKNMSFKILFSKTSNLCSCLSVRHPVSQTCETAGKFDVLLKAFFSGLEGRRDVAVFHLNNNKFPQKLRFFLGCHGSVNEVSSLPRPTRTAWS